ncbi:hypothetical protein SAMN06265219_101466 [Gracilimonas mengyeensis]|uniref:Uncharacterized protein n=2 Tax=Gracilimonas mengyeensis TaxID=1302730 RepID=A0A521AYW1_9BACT|nr:hypothetical protein SAMN06265219_101466 [Gracilimonas mengyeensis]
MLLLTVYSGTATAQEFKPVINKPIIAESISEEDLFNNFLKVRTKWGDKTKITPKDLEEKELSAIAVYNYWQQSVFPVVRTTALKCYAGDSDFIELIMIAPNAVDSFTSPAGSTKIKEPEI